MVANVTGEGGKKGEWSRFSWMLERRFPTRYGAKQRIEHSGEVGVNGIAELLSLAFEDAEPA